MNNNTINKDPFKGFIIMLFIPLLLICNNALAAVRQVPSAYSTIQAAVNAASSGDTIEVSPGTYNESVTLKSGITLHGLNRQSTVINAAVTGKRGIIVPYPSSNITISNLTVKGGIAEGSGLSDPYGGGIFVDGSTGITISDCDIMNNSSVHGGGVAFRNSSASLRNNLITNNFARSTKDSSVCQVSGGGIFVWSASSNNNQLTVSGNQIVGNKSQVPVPPSGNPNGCYAIGGGMFHQLDTAMANHSITITNNNFLSNQTSGAQYYGGGIYIYTSNNSQVQVTNNTFSNNSALDGGGIAVIESNVSILNNRFYNNIARWGGGIYGWHMTSRIEGNILNKNIASDDACEGSYTTCSGGGGILFDVATSDSAHAFKNNLVIGNVSDSWGGGLDLYQTSYVISSNKITKNNATWGGGMLVNTDGGVASNPDINNNLITDNIAMDWGGGIGIGGVDQTGQFRNNLIARNQAVNNTGGGIVISNAHPAIINNTMFSNLKGGIRVDSSTPPTVMNNIIVSNHDSYGISSAYSTFTPIYNDVWDNLSGHNYEGTSGGTGSISSDPKFVNAGKNDFHLLSGSPGIDTGNPDSAYLDADHSRNNMGMYGGPAAATTAFPEYLYPENLPMVVRANDDTLWTGSFNSSGDFNNNWGSLPGLTPSTPSLVWSPISNQLAWKLVVRAADNSLWAASFNPSGTFNNDWVCIPGLTSSTPALAWNPAASKIQLVVRAADDSLWAASFNSSGVFNNDWTVIPGAASSTPALAWNAPVIELQLVIRANDDSIWSASFNSTGAFNNDWLSISGKTASPPALAGTL
jgi:parallel beta-helix repeat protein